jgi:hypothetical protein
LLFSVLIVGRDIIRMRKLFDFLKQASAFCFAVFLLMAFNVKAQDSSLKLHYSFDALNQNDSLIDLSGNGYHAKLKRGAALKVLGDEHFMVTGSDNGYLEFGAKMGQLVQSLTNFTISTYVFIDQSLDLTRNGNFIWCFSNAEDILASATGCMFYSAKISQYAISPNNWLGEKKLGLGTAAVKGKWQHVAYTQSGTLGTLYIDGVAKKSGSVTMVPADLGTPGYNYLARSSYSQDQYLQNSMYNDFRIYNRALGSSEITVLANKLSVLDELVYNELAHAALNEITIENANSITNNIDLSLSGSYGATITWQSSLPQVVTNNGVVTRPAYGFSSVEVTLTATLTVGTVSLNKQFVVTVLPFYSDAESVNFDLNNLVLSGNLQLLRSNLVLPLTGSEGTTISWQTSNGNVLSNSGAIVNRPLNGQGHATVTLTATVSKGSASGTKDFVIIVAEDEGYVAYLFSYFTGNSGDQESIRFAISQDGYVYKALNSNKPIIASSAISSTGGVRDPHILRGTNDNMYYMVVTDMVSANGWNSNRAMVLLKSSNLVDWTHTIINIPQTYASFSSVDRVWAPQTIFDEVNGKYMVYFSMRKGASDTDKIYYAYANSSFTGFEGEPQLLFNNPGVASIDGDIVMKDGMYHLFFKTEGAGAGIKKAVSENLTSGYVMHNEYLQQTTNAVEGGCVFRLINSDKWILMYDMYTSGAYQLTHSYDLLNFQVVPNTVSFDFAPRHGTVMPITQSELNALNAKWNPVTGVVLPAKKRLKIYPVPARKWINVDTPFSAGDKAYVSIYNLNGVRVFNQKVTNTQERYNISSLAKGFYLVKYDNGQGVNYTTQLVVD